ncbi:hypothetical protein SAMN05421636_10469 [Pricia antarctica]|uniref:4Fe-4S ferredoxin-type domain-containing protein n=1 Tax=Pricia antarctica TaxID=641691 RepID=A0A1G7BA45_9FLAO|nr:hypothetical protein [Pricia antarctica]SDE23891.1 hypothetical protein SAMN05421636_10469 [Pricia antarctica]
MKTRKNINYITMALVLAMGLLGSLNQSCQGACVEEWKECRNNCPTEEEGEEAADACFKRCPPNDFTCQVECQRKTREACVGQCGDALGRCLDRGQ